MPNPPNHTVSSRPAWEWLILIAVAILTITVLLPNRPRPGRRTGPRNACINNLRQIDGAKEQWALEKNHTNGAPPIIAEIDYYIRGGPPKCPNGGIYTYGKVDEPPRCTIANHILP